MVLYSLYNVSDLGLLNGPLNTVECAHLGVNVNAVDDRLELGVYGDTSNRCWNQVFK